MNNGWIKLHRKSLKSSIWGNPTYWMVWCWCLLRANHEEHSFPFNGKDISISEGEFITGRKKAVAEIPTLTPQKYRSAIKYLKSTSRITIKSNNKFSLIKINKWEDYQGSNQLDNQQITNKQPTNNQQITTYKNDKNDKKDKKSSRFTPPSLLSVKEYITQQGYGVDADNWYDFYSSKGWMVGKNKMKDWQACVRTWQRRENGSSSEDDKISKILNT